MKRTIILAITLLLAITAKAQTNIQEMYDFNRGHLTTTIEHFNTDKWGSTFFFTDIYHPKTEIPYGYYTEIARGLNFWQNSALGALSLHVEWNGGNFASNAWLLGFEYLLHNADYSNTLTLEAMYKNIRTDCTFMPFDHASDIPLQLTAVWNMHDLLGVKGLCFSGFLDFWWENYHWETHLTATGNEYVVTKCILLSEPQIWYNIGQHFGCENLNIGGEVEIAYNFAGGHYSGLDFNKNEGWTVAPCLGIKWVF